MESGIYEMALNFTHSRHNNRNFESVLKLDNQKLYLPWKSNGRDMLESFLNVLHFLSPSWPFILWNFESMTYMTYYDYTQYPDRIYERNTASRRNEPHISSYRFTGTNINLVYLANLSTEQTRDTGCCLYPIVHFEWKPTYDSHPGHARDFAWYRGQRPSPARVIKMTHNNNSRTRKCGGFVA